MAPFAFEFLFNKYTHSFKDLKTYQGQRAKENLCSEKSLEIRSQRPVEVDSVFGDVKGNFGCTSYRDLL